MKRLQEMGYLDKNADLAQFRASLAEKQIIDESKPGFATLTSKGERMIRQDALNRIFNNLKRGTLGEHHPAGGGRRHRLRRRPAWRDGHRRVAHHAQLAAAPGPSCGSRRRFRGQRARAPHEGCATVLFLDISSMILYGEDRITPAKKVALAMAGRSRRAARRTRPGRSFGDDATGSASSTAHVGAGPTTNTRGAAALAAPPPPEEAPEPADLHGHRRKLLITEHGKLYKNPFGLDPKIVGLTLEEAAACRRNKIVITTFMLTQEPALVDFVNKLTQVNKGRAYFSAADNLGGSVFVDYLRNR
jgi:hypothetical protein